MTTIEAWKRMKVGQKAENKAGYLFYKYDDYGFMLSLQESLLSDEAALADDWEIVKEPKKIIYLDVVWALSKDYSQIVAKTSGVDIGFELLNKPPMTMTLEWVD